MSGAEDGLRLELPARAENVALVRHAVAGLAEAMEMEEARIGDLKTVVTEAAMNVVVHAYDGAPGPLRVDAYPSGDAICVVVRDQGSGVRPKPDLERASLRLGLPLIAALSSSFEISGGLGKGTEIRMTVSLRADDEEPERGDGAGWAEAERRAALISVADGDHVAPVISRVVSMLAARADFSIDRLADTMLVGDAIAARAPDGFADRTVRLVVEQGQAAIRLRVGPMAEGAGERVRRDLDLPQLGSILDKLADDISVDRDGDGEYLSLQIAQSSQTGQDARG